MVRQSDNLGYWSLFTCRSRKAGLIRHPNLSHGQTTSDSGGELFDEHHVSYDTPELLPLHPLNRLDRAPVLAAGALPMETLGGETALAALIDGPVFQEAGDQFL